MKTLLGIIFCLALGNISFGQTLQQIEAKRVMLPNGWALTPVGKNILLGDLPLNMAISPSKKWMAITNNGQSDQSVELVDLKNQRVADSLLVGKSWLGLAFSDNGKFLYASGGNDNIILRLAIKGTRLVPSDTFVLGKPWPEKISPAGLAVDDKNNRLYVVTKESNELYILNTGTKEIIRHLPLPAEGYTCLLSADKKTLFISCWGCDKVLLFDTKENKWLDPIPVGDNPNEMCFSKDGKRLFVCNSNDNSVSVIDLTSHKVIETLNTALYPNAPSGSTTNSAAVSDDGKTLYVANADNNCLSAFDISVPGQSASKGFIPVGWYPTCVRVVGNTIYVANGKGLSSLPNPQGPNPRSKEQTVTYQKGDTKKPKKEQYIGGLFRGQLSIIPVPSQEQLQIFSQVVYHNTPYAKDKETTATIPVGNPIPSKVGNPSPIKHVFYIIKENRTYDQVLGDVPTGNGDTSLVLFGERVTPNQHALVKEFVLLDNFYVDGEVSADGHNWSTGAYATDFLEKTWPTSYGGRGGEYDAEGNREVANNKNGFIWDMCKRHNVTYRTYGEFADDYKPNIPVLKDHFCPYYTSWDQKVADTTRFRQWARDFDSLASVGAVPQLNTLRLINDHTEGLRSGRPTPPAHVADNDYAVGLFVEHLSKSPLWKESVVFIVEDDAQNGPDHVDAHRSTTYVAGGFAKRNYVDHSMYSTSSLLHTIELILGLPPMSQYDAAAVPMWRCFSNDASPKGFNSLPPQIALTDKNTAYNRWSKMSDEFDFTAEDRVPDAQLNEVIWVAVKGETAQCPPPVHAAFLKPVERDDD